MSLCPDFDLRSIELPAMKTIKIIKGDKSK